MSAEHIKGHTRTSSWPQNIPRQPKQRRTDHQPLKGCEDVGAFPSSPTTTRLESTSLQFALERDHPLSSGVPSKEATWLGEINTKKENFLVEDDPRDPSTWALYKQFEDNTKNLDKIISKADGNSYSMMDSLRHPIQNNSECQSGLVNGNINNHPKQQTCQTPETCAPSSLDINANLLHENRGFGTQPKLGASQSNDSSKIGLDEQPRSTASQEINSLPYGQSTLNDSNKENVTLNRSAGVKSTDSMMPTSLQSTESRNTNGEDLHSAEQVTHKDGDSCGVFSTPASIVRVPTAQLPSQGSVLSDNDHWPYQQYCSDCPDTSFQLKERRENNKDKQWNEPYVVLPCINGSGKSVYALNYEDKYCGFERHSPGFQHADTGDECLCRCLSSLHLSDSDSSDSGLLSFKQLLYDKVDELITKQTDFENRMQDQFGEVLKVLSVHTSNEIDIQEKVGAIQKELQTLHQWIATLDQKYRVQAENSKEATIKLHQNFVSTCSQYNEDFQTLQKLVSTATSKVNSTIKEFKSVKKQVETNKNNFERLKKAITPTRRQGKRRRNTSRGKVVVPVVSETRNFPELRSRLAAGFKSFPYPIGNIEFGICEFPNEKNSVVIYVLYLSTGRLDDAFSKEQVFENILLNKDGNDVLLVCLRRGEKELTKPELPPSILAKVPDSTNFHFVQLVYIDDKLIPTQQNKCEFATLRNFVLDKYYPYED